MNSPQAAQQPPNCEVLLVDDDENVVMVIGDYLQGKGFRVVRATSGQMALELLPAHPDIKIAVLDFDMPVMNGMALLERINLLKKESGLKMQVLFLTAQNSSILALNLLRKQVFFYMSKPVNLHQLVEALQDAYRELDRPPEPSVMSQVSD
ncbi:MAG: response regulator [Candidatus Wallbacteria bacterium]|nr:response regulator [Candidatus Wallbacteria bacterium]